LVILRLVRLRVVGLRSVRFRFLPPGPGVPCALWLFTRDLPLRRVRPAGMRRGALLLARGRVARPRFGGRGGGIGRLGRRGRRLARRRRGRRRVSLRRTARRRLLSRQRFEELATAPLVLLAAVILTLVVAPAVRRRLVGRGVRLLGILRRRRWRGDLLARIVRRLLKIAHAIPL